MRPFSFFVLLLGCSFAAFAGGGQRQVSSTLRSATVYRAGAELTHIATAQLERGANELIVGDLSNVIDIASIRVNCTANVTVLSATFSTDHLRAETPSPFVKKLMDSIDGIHREQGRLDILIKSDNELLELLTANKNIGGTTSGVTVAELSKMMDYYRQKVLALRTELSGYSDRSQRLNSLAGRLNQQIKEDERRNTTTTGNIVLQLMSPSAGPCDLTISYLTNAARWVPSYDLKVDNATDPLHIFYKARIVQTSGLDWKQVKLSLSTSLPTQSGDAPVLRARFFQFAGAIVPGLALGNSMQNTISGVQFKKDILEYKSTRKTDFDAAPPISDYISLNDRTMDAVFDIDLPYDIPGNGKEQGVTLKEYQLPCVYQYYAAPIADRDAYLLGQLTGWEKLNLLPGDASIMVEGTYIGKSHIDPNALQDTLILTLGRDKRIVVKKEKITDYSSVKFLGSSKKQVFTYQITVRNNKKEKIRMILKDQYPLSTDKDIEEELLENGGATVNPDTGILTWNLELAPGESRSYRISYSIRYPKDKNLNIN